METQVKECVDNIRRETDREKINYYIHKDEPHIVHDMTEQMNNDIDFAAYVAWCLRELEEKIGKVFYFYQHEELLDEINNENGDKDKIINMLDELTE